MTERDVEHGAENDANFIPANRPHRHDLPSRANADDLTRCTLCGRWFFALPNAVWRGPNTHWSPVSWWNRKHKRRIADHRANRVLPPAERRTEGSE